MATTELEALLAGLGLARYLKEFRTEMIDDACLDSLEPEDMRAKYHYLRILQNSNRS